MDLLSAEVGATVELSDVLLIAGNGDIRIGQPTLEGARVIAEVVEHGRDPKIIVFKYKPKTRYRRRRGHRQGYTRLAVRQILTAEEPAEAEAKPKRRRATKAETKAEAKATRPKRKRKAVEPDAKAKEAPVEVGAVELSEAEVKPARRTRVRKATKPKAEAAEAPAAATAPETPEAEAKPARRTRKAAVKGEAEKPNRTRKKTESD